MRLVGAGSTDELSLSDVRGPAFAVTNAGQVPVQDRRTFHMERALLMSDDTTKRETVQARYWFFAFMAKIAVDLLTLVY